MKATKRILAIAVAGLAIGAIAAPSVEITNVQQQYPWTNTVDITYTVAGVKDFPAKTATGGYASNETYFVTFEAKNRNALIKDVNGNTVFTNALVNGSKSGQVAQWHPALGQQLTGCTMAPSVFRGEDDAYLVVNLETNKNGKFEAWFEPMSTQDASNKRYNTDEYKLNKMVFRRIPKGHPVYLDKVNMGYTVTNDYYIGVFHVTAGQYKALETPGTAIANTAANKMPRRSISYNTIRGSASYAAPVGPGVVANLNARVQLAGRTGLYFDLPTKQMWEVACRGNTALTTTYYWGNDAAKWSAYATTSNSRTGLRVSGSLLPNDIGLYDIVGNAWNLVRNAPNPPKTQTYLFGVHGSGTNCDWWGAAWNNPGIAIDNHWTVGVNSTQMSDGGFRLALYP